MNRISNYNVALNVFYRSDFGSTSLRTQPTIIQVIKTAELNISV